jgi:hypothetical protein
VKNIRKVAPSNRGTPVRVRVGPPFFPCKSSAGQDHFTNNGHFGFNIICIIEESGRFKIIIVGQEWAVSRLS